MNTSQFAFVVLVHIMFTLFIVRLFIGRNRNSSIKLSKISSDYTVSVLEPEHWFDR